MHFVPVRDFRVNSAAVWNTLEEQERVIVTNHGQPTAIMLKVDAESVMSTVATIERAQWIELLTRMQTQVPPESRGMSLDDINAEIAAARMEQ